MADVTIGLETHIQLDTNTKLFCGCRTELGAEPNQNTCEICLGMPGAKPRTNRAVVENAVKASLALACDINDEVRFSRKVYFYPDMSKNYQITQYELPVGQDGVVTLGRGDDETQIRIKRLHIEEDPARLVHVGGDIASADYTRIDYNRAGVPLLEIVTKPDFSSPKQARLFLQKLTRIMEYLGIYDSSSDLSIKSDANISIQGGERVEVKNITGTKGIEKALNYEITRQRNLSKRGRQIERQTRSYSSAQEITAPLRQKESEAGYGYIFEPDLTRLQLDDETVDALEGALPELPDQKYQRFIDEYGIAAKMAESLITDRELADDFEQLAEAHDPTLTASWLTGELKKTLNYRDLMYTGSPVGMQDLDTLLDLLEDDRITDRNAEQALRKVVAGEGGMASIVEEYDLLKEGIDLDAVVRQVVDENPDAVADVRAGKGEAVNFLVGKVMKETRGKADPREARKVVERVIENE